MQIKENVAGFTLIELLVTIVIVGILSTISTVTYKNYMKESRDTRRLVSLTRMEQAMHRGILLDEDREHKYKFGEGKYNNMNQGSPNASFSHEDAKNEFREMMLANGASIDDFVDPLNGNCYVFGYRYRVAPGTYYAANGNYISSEDDYFIAAWSEAENDIMVIGTEGGRGGIDCAKNNGSWSRLGTILNGNAVESYKCSVYQATKSPRIA